MPDLKTPIIEGEIVGTDADSTLDTSATMNNIISQIDHLKEEVGKYKDMLDSIFANDATYQMHDSAVKDAAKVKSQTRKQILRLPQALDLSSKIADKKAHLKELQSDLSGYLQDYSQKTGFTTFESSAGDLLEIVVDYRYRKISK